MILLRIIYRTCFELVQHNTMSGIKKLSLIIILPKPNISYLKKSFSYSEAS